MRLNSRLVISRDPRIADCDRSQWVRDFENLTGSVRDLKFFWILVVIPGYKFNSQMVIPYLQRCKFYDQLELHQVLG